MHDTRDSKIALVAASVLSLAIAAIVIQRSLASREEDLSRLQKLPGFTPIPQMSEFYNSTVHQLRNELAPKRNWTADEAHYLADIVKAGFPERALDRSTRSLDDVELHSIYMTTISTISERFTINGPMDPDARELLQQVLLNELVSPNWNARSCAVSCVVQANLVTDSAIRAKVERLRNDPNPVVAENANRLNLPTPGGRGECISDGSPRTVRG